MEPTPSVPSSCAQKFHWNMVVPPDNTTLAYNFLRMSTSHFMMYWKEASWNPLASLPVKRGWNNTSAQWKLLEPTVMMFPSGSSRSSPGQAIELCVVIHTNVAQFPMTSRTISLSAVAVKEYLSLSEDLHQILCKFTAIQTKDGVIESVTFVDGHCVRHSVTRDHSQCPSCVPKRTETGQSGSPCTMRAR